MTLNISNPTLQDWTVMYRLGAPNSEEWKTLRQIVLRRGQQIDLILSDEGKAQLVRHLETYGARDAAEVHARLANFSGLIYRDNGVIEREEIEMAHESDVDMRQDRSVTQAVRGALGFDNAVRKANKVRPSARITETTVEQEVARGSHPTGNEVRFNLTVDPEGRSDVSLPV